MPNGGRSVCRSAPAQAIRQHDAFQDDIPAKMIRRTVYIATRAGRTPKSTTRTWVRLQCTIPKEINATPNWLDERDIIGAYI